MTYHVMFKDTPVADVILNEHLVQNIIKFVPDSPMQPFWGDLNKMSKQALTNRFYIFIKDRCYEDSRVDLSAILRSTGLDNNNPYEWIRISHGVTWEDFFWIKTDNENIQWDDVRIRR